jgi:hypothetical protein
MKKMFLPLIIICLVGSAVFAQNNSRMNKEMRPLQRIEQLEKIKLIEILGLDEETAIRFFIRRRDNQMKVKGILDQRDFAINELENEIKNGSQTNDAVYKDQVNKLISMESRITSERENFVKSLSDLLTPQQIAKLIVFESKFRREVRETLMGRDKVR